MRVLDLFVAALALPSLAATLYLAMLALASLWRVRTGAPSLRQRFLCVVPAHNEAAGIARTVHSLLAVAYPAERRRLLVVADNCDDETAERAEEAGAQVLVRRNLERRGK